MKRVTFRVDPRKYWLAKSRFAETYTPFLCDTYDKLGGTLSDGRPLLKDLGYWLKVNIFIEGDDEKRPDSTTLREVARKVSEFFEFELEGRHDASRPKFLVNRENEKSEYDFLIREDRENFAQYLPDQAIFIE